jgi:hypothetical protein
MHVLRAIGYYIMEGRSQDGFLPFQFRITTRRAGPHFKDIVIFANVTVFLATYSWVIMGTHFNLQQGYDFLMKKTILFSERKIICTFAAERWQSGRLRRS